MFLFKVSAVAMVFIGAQMNLILAWSLADILMTGMATLNILAILFLSDIVKRTLQDYMIQKKAGEEPVFKAKELGIKNAECWE